MKLGQLTLGVSALMLTVSFSAPESVSAQALGYSGPSAADALPWTFHRAVGRTLRAQHDIRRAQTFSLLGFDTSAAFRALAKISPFYDSGLSWRATNCVSPVRNQGGCGSCWAFGATHSLEAAWCLENNATIDGSEQNILECRSDVTRNEDRCLGSWETVAYDVMRANGIDSEARRPYTPGTYAATCAAPVGLQTFYGIDGATHLTVPIGGTRPTVADIKNAIVENGSVTLALTVTPAFDNHGANSPAINTTADDLTRARGGHMVSIIGWDDVQRAWRIKNSWGTGWGNAGFGFITYNDRSIWANNYSVVDPAVRWNQAERARIFKAIATRLFVLPQLFTSNPRVQWPTSLGFPNRKISIVEGFQDAIARSLVSPLDVRVWPALVRDLINHVD